MDIIIILALIKVLMIPLWIGHLTLCFKWGTVYLLFEIESYRGGGSASNSRDRRGRIRRNRIQWILENHELKNSQVNIIVQTQIVTCLQRNWIFATNSNLINQCYGPFKLWILRSNSPGWKYRSVPPSGCKDIGILFQLILGTKDT